MDKDYFWSALEAFIIVCVGFTATLAIQLIFYPILNIKSTIESTSTMSIIFASGSFIKIFVIRRIFDRINKKRQSKLNKCNCNCNREGSSIH